MFIDRFLASTFSYNIDTVLLFNKVDDTSDKEDNTLKTFLDTNKT
mgnify:CR=1 FL=1